MATDDKDNREDEYIELHTTHDSRLPVYRKIARKQIIELHTTHDSRLPVYISLFLIVSTIYNV